MDGKGGGLVENIIAKIKPGFDKKIDEAKAELKADLKRIEAKLDEIKGMLKKNG